MHHMGIVEHPCSAEQRVLLERLRARVSAESGDSGAHQPADSHEAPDDALLARFLRARKWDVEAARQQFVTARAWRREHDVGRWRRAAAGPFVADAAKEAANTGYGAVEGAGAEAFPQVRLVGAHPLEHVYRSWGASANFGHAKDGSPVYYERTGVMSARGLSGMLAEATEDGPVDRHIWQQELMMARMEEASATLGRRVDQQIVVLDMAGLSFWPNAAGLRIFKRIIKIDASFYPETLRVQYIVNAPFIFSAIWAVVRPWLDPVTAAKVRIVGHSGTASALLERIDASQLPAEYGGQVRMRGSPLEPAAMHAHAPAHAQAHAQAPAWCVELCVERTARGSRSHTKRHALLPHPAAIASSVPELVVCVRVWCAQSTFAMEPVRCDPTEGMALARALHRASDAGRAASVRAGGAPPTEAHPSPMSRDEVEPVTPSVPSDPPSPPMPQDEVELLPPSVGDGDGKLRSAGYSDGAPRATSVVSNKHAPACPLPAVRDE